jgi:hypothetical protein
LVYLLQIWISKAKGDLTIAEIDKSILIRKYEIVRKGGLAMVSKKCGRAFMAVFIVFFGLLVAQWPCFAADEDKAVDEKKPQRAIVMAAEYPGVVIAKDEDVSMDIIFHNKGRKDEDVEVWIVEKPKGWQAKIPVMIKASRLKLTRKKGLSPANINFE